MVVARTVAEVRREVGSARMHGQSIGFVPTMGSLHEGHLRLVDRCIERRQFSVMSIFVNPIQFNVEADFDAYPREEERDLDLARERGVDLVFLPSNDEMYAHRLTHVDMNGLVDHLCGAARPGHFRGVLTVVAKLFNIVQPDTAVFGQKDIQQARAIEKMTSDLNFPVEIDIAPTVREVTGLAMSSRNAYLSSHEKERALVLFRAMEMARSLIEKGERKSSVLVDAMTEIIHQGEPLTIDYVSIVDHDRLQPIDLLGEKNIIALAVFFGMARLIDNMIVTITDGGVSCL